MEALGRCTVPAYGQTAALITLEKKILTFRSRSYYNGGCSKLYSKLRTMATSKTSGEIQKERPIANFGHDVWEDVFADYTRDTQEIRKKKEEEHKMLKEEVERHLQKIGEEPIQFLKWVDEIERLGVAYHFENTIEEGLKKNYEKVKEQCQSYDLYHTSLMVRLFRQHRYYISSGVFERFLNDQGNFQESLKEEPLSMLSLYEAGYVKAQGEEILEKALEFTKIHLKGIVENQPNHQLAPQIERALRYPNQRGVTRLESRHFISFYEKYPCHNKNLLRFAKLDYDFVQTLYKEELKETTRWYKKFNLAKRFPFARIRPVQSHFFSMAMFYEPKFSLSRMIYTKITLITTILDDIYDAFGTTEELEVYTDFIEKWDKDRIDVRLPNYMKEYFEILYDVYKECEDDLSKTGGRNNADHLIRETIHLCKAYLQEASWREAKYVPPYDEFIENGIRTGTALSVCMAILVNDAEESIAEKTFDIISNNGHPQRASSIIARCLNDMASFEFDKQREHVAGAVECFMNQYGVDKDEACVGLHDIVECEWKVLDEEFFKPKTDIPTSLLIRFLTFARVCNYIYKCDNAHSLASQRMNTTFSLLYIQPVN